LIRPTSTSAVAGELLGAVARVTRRLGDHRRLEAVKPRERLGEQPPVTIAGQCRDEPGNYSDELSEAK
jgi:hypothetical protein